MVAFQPVVHHASRITHHIVAGYQGEVYCVLKAEGNVVLPVISAVRCPDSASCRALTPARWRDGGGKLKLIP